MGKRPLRCERSIRICQFYQTSRPSCHCHSLAVFLQEAFLACHPAYRRACWETWRPSFCERRATLMYTFVRSRRCCSEFFVVTTSSKAREGKTDRQTSEDASCRAASPLLQYCIQYLLSTPIELCIFGTSRPALINKRSRLHNCR